MTNLYCVKDVKSSMWKPFCVVNDPVAIREFALLVKSPQCSDIANDLELWRLGTFDELTGAIDSNVEYVCAFRDVMEVKNECE